MVWNNKHLHIVDPGPNLFFVQILGRMGLSHGEGLRGEGEATQNGSDSSSETCFSSIAALCTPWNKSKSLFLIFPTS